MSAPGGLHYDRYSVAGRPEWLMRIGPGDGRPLLVVAPLFEEMNRTRALLAGVMRALGEEGFRCVLPDLPGTGESERDLAACGWSDWTDAVRAAAALLGPDLLVVSIRGGALLDDVPARAHWRLAPAEGASLARDLARSGLVGGGASGGYFPGEDLLAALKGAVPAGVRPLRTVRLASDRQPADGKLDGPALWRRSEPAVSSELAAAIACDVSTWARQCVAS